MKIRQTRISREIRVYFLSNEEKLGKGQLSITAHNHGATTVEDEGKA
jgi:hypothetical protein